MVFDEEDRAIMKDILATISSMQTSLKTSCEEIKESIGRSINILSHKSVEVAPVDFREVVELEGNAGTKDSCEVEVEKTITEFVQHLSTITNNSSLYVGTDVEQIGMRYFVSIPDQNMFDKMLRRDMFNFFQITNEVVDFVCLTLNREGLNKLKPPILWPLWNTGNSVSMKVKRLVKVQQQGAAILSFTSHQAKGLRKYDSNWSYFDRYNRNARHEETRDYTMIHYLSRSAAILHFRRNIIKLLARVVKPDMHSGLVDFQLVCWCAKRLLDLPLVVREVKRLPYMFQRDSGLYNVILQQGLAASVLIRVPINVKYPLSTLHNWISGAFLHQLLYQASISVSNGFDQWQNDGDTSVVTFRSESFFQAKKFKVVESYETVSGFPTHNKGIFQPKAQTDGSVLSKKTVGVIEIGIEVVRLTVASELQVQRWDSDLQSPYGGLCNMVKQPSPFIQQHFSIPSSECMDLDSISIPAFEYAMYGAVNNITAGSLDSVLQYNRVAPVLLTTFLSEFFERPVQLVRWWSCVLVLQGAYIRATVMRILQGSYFLAGYVLIGVVIEVNGRFPLFIGIMVLNHLGKISGTLNMVGSNDRENNLEALLQNDRVHDSNIPCNISHRIFMSLAPTEIFFVLLWHIAWYFTKHMLIFCVFLGVCTSYQEQILRVEAFQENEVWEFLSPIAAVLIDSTVKTVTLWQMAWAEVTQMIITFRLVQDLSMFQSSYLIAIRGIIHTTSLQGTCSVLNYNCQVILILASVVRLISSKARDMISYALYHVEACEIKWKMGSPTVRNVIMSIFGETIMDIYLSKVTCMVAELQTVYGISLHPLVSRISVSSALWLARRVQLKLQDNPIGIAGISSYIFTWSHIRFWQISGWQLSSKEFGSGSVVLMDVRLQTGYCVARNINTICIMHDIIASIAPSSSEFCDPNNISGSLCNLTTSMSNQVHGLIASLGQKIWSTPIQCLQVDQLNQEDDDSNFYRLPIVKSSRLVFELIDRRMDIGSWFNAAFRISLRVNHVEAEFQHWFWRCQSAILENIKTNMNLGGDHNNNQSCSTGHYKLAVTALQDSDCSCDHGPVLVRIYIKAESVREERTGFLNSSVQVDAGYPSVLACDERKEHLLLRKPSCNKAWASAFQQPRCHLFSRYANVASSHSVGLHHIPWEPGPVLFGWQHWVLPATIELRALDDSSLLQVATRHCCMFPCAPDPLWHFTGSFSMTLSDIRQCFIDKLGRTASFPLSDVRVNITPGDRQEVSVLQSVFFREVSGRSEGTLMDILVHIAWVLIRNTLKYLSLVGPSAIGDVADAFRHNVVIRGNGLMFSLLTGEYDSSKMAVFANILVNGDIHIRTRSSLQCWLDKRIPECWDQLIRGYFGVRIWPIVSSVNYNGILLGIFTSQHKVFSWWVSLYKVYSFTGVTEIDSTDRPSHDIDAVDTELYLFDIVRLYVVNYFLGLFCAYNLQLGMAIQA